MWKALILRYQRVLFVCTILSAHIQLWKLYAAFTLRVIPDYLTASGSAAVSPCIIIFSSHASVSLRAISLLRSGGGSRGKICGFRKDLLSAKRAHNNHLRNLKEMAIDVKVQIKHIPKVHWYCRFRAFICRWDAEERCHSFRGIRFTHLLRCLGWRLEWTCDGVVLKLTELNAYLRVKVRRLVERSTLGLA